MLWNLSHIWKSTFFFIWQIFVNTAKSGTEIKPTEPFQQHWPISTNIYKTASGEIIAMPKAASYLSCFKCGWKANSTKNVAECNTSPTTKSIRLQEKMVPPLNVQHSRARSFNSHRFSQLYFTTNWEIRKFPCFGWSWSITAWSYDIWPT